MQHMLLHKQCIWAERQRRLGLGTKNHLENQKDLCSNPGFFSVTPKHPPQAASFIALQPHPPAIYWNINQAIASHCSKSLLFYL